MSDITPKNVRLIAGLPYTASILLTKPLNHGIDQLCERNFKTKTAKVKSTSKRIRYNMAYQMDDKSRICPSFRAASCFIDMVPFVLINCFIMFTRSLSLAHVWHCGMGSFTINLIWTPENIISDVFHPSRTQVFPHMRIWIVIEIARLFASAAQPSLYMYLEIYSIKSLPNCWRCIFVLVVLNRQPTSRPHLLAFFV